MSTGGAVGVDVAVGARAVGAGAVGVDGAVGAGAVGVVVGVAAAVGVGCASPLSVTDAGAGSWNDLRATVDAMPMSSRESAPAIYRARTGTPEC